MGIIPEAREEPNYYYPTAKSRWVYAYAMDALQQKKLKHRDVLLLAHIDHWTDPYETRVKVYEDGWERLPFVDFKTKCLRKILHAENEAVVATIDRLNRWKQFHAERLDSLTWRLWTTPEPRERYTDESLLIPPSVVSGFESGKMTPFEMLLTAKIIRFTRKWEICHPSNKWLGRFFGVEPEWVSDAITNLRAKGILSATYLTQVELNDLLLEEEGWERKPKRGLVARLLHTTEKLEKGDWVDPKPEEVDLDDYLPKPSTREDDEDNQFVNMMFPPKRREPVSQPKHEDGFDPDGSMPCVPNPVILATPRTPRPDFTP